MTRAFVDTNVVAYAFDSRDPVKREVARDLLLGGRVQPVLSTQVLVEVANVLLRGLPEPWTLGTVRDIVGELAGFEVVPTDVPLVRVGLAEAERWQFSHWDGLIVAAARQARVDVLLTEDLTHDQDLDGVPVRNPFVDS